jgi:hypothetical protein
LILEHLFFITVADNLRRFPFVARLARFVFPFTVAIRNKHTDYTREQVARYLIRPPTNDLQAFSLTTSSRLEGKCERKDFLTNLVGKVESREIAKEEMTAHASTLM